MATILRVYYVDDDKSDMSFSALEIGKREIVEWLPKEVPRKLKSFVKLARELGYKPRKVVAVPRLLVDACTPESAVIEMSITGGAVYVTEKLKK
jgi:hypothetical protein